MDVQRKISHVSRDTFALERTFGRALVGAIDFDLAGRKNKVRLFVRLGSTYYGFVVEKLKVRGSKQIQF